jgi:hypothetical protein
MINGNSFKDGAEFSKLVIQNNGNSVSLGPCRLLSEPNIDGYDWRLVFNKDVYNFESLLVENKVNLLQDAFYNLPLILSHKKKIRESFKNYTADLTYDLSVYKNLFDGLDSKYAEEPENIKKTIQQAIINTEGKSFMGFLDDKLADLEKVVADFSREEHETHGYYFRRQLWNIILCSRLMTRTNLKPRGYAGDSEMMKMLYENDYSGESTFSKLMHKHPVEQIAAQAVRNRRHTIAKKIISAKRHFGEKMERIRVLSIASGPVCELQDILLSPEDCKKYHFTFLDQDRVALTEAAGSVFQIEKHYKTKINVDYLNESVRTMLRTPDLKKKWGEFHFIYSLGLFDYLTPPVASAVLVKLYELLTPGGQIVIGSFHASNPSNIYGILA